MTSNLFTEPLDQVTPLILSYNEDPNIARTLACLTWAHRIVVIDSGSTDNTLRILSSFPQVYVITRPFDTHAQQWNFGLQHITTDWVLSLDADYQVSRSLLSEIRSALQESTLDVAGFRIPFTYYVYGKPLRSTVLPSRIALFRKSYGSYVDDGHTQNLLLHGRCETLRSPLIHDDRKPLSRWLWAQERYLNIELVKLLSRSAATLSVADRIRKLCFVAPGAMLFMCLIWHRGILDGWRGWFYAFQRCYVEILLSLMLLDAHLNHNESQRMSNLPFNSAT